MVYHGLVHTCNINRPAHTKVGGRKTPLATTSSATNVECRIESVADTQTFSVLGKGALETYLGIFATGTSVRIGDEIVWTDPSPDVTLDVEGVREFANSWDGGAEEHFEAFLKRRDL